MSVGFVPNSVLKSNVLRAVAASFEPCVVPSLREYLVLESAGEAGAEPAASAPICSAS